MPDDSKTSAPIEIIIRVDPTAATQAVKRGANSAWRAAKSETAILCYWIAGAAIVLFVVAALVMSGILSPRIIGGTLAIATFAGLAALKQRFFPLIRD